MKATGLTVLSQEVLLYRWISMGAQKLSPNLLEQDL